MADFLHNLLHFVPVTGPIEWLYIIASLLAVVVLIVILQSLPQQARRPMILVVTFLGGLFYALEFLLPTHHMVVGKTPMSGNFLTPGILVFGQLSPIIAGFGIGLGVFNLVQIHGKRVIKASTGAFFSYTFFASMLAMCTVNILQQAHPNAINKNLNTLLFDGGLQSLDATMFSIIAFYIVSAAYRAFRVRSLEATLLLGTAILVMLGQIPIGTFLTHALPHALRIEVIRNWILTVPNAAAIRAIAFGLGVGALAVALRIWLGLERGSYFDTQ